MEPAAFRQVAIDLIANRHCGAQCGQGRQNACWSLRVNVDGQPPSASNIGVPGKLARHGRAKPIRCPHKQGWIDRVRSEVVFVVEGCFLGVDARTAKKPARQQRLHLTDWVRHVVCVARGPGSRSARRRTSPCFRGLQPSCVRGNCYCNAWSANTIRLWQNTPSPTVLAKPLKPRKTQRHQRNARFKPEIVPSIPARKAWQ